MVTEIANNKRYINAIQADYPYEFKSEGNDHLKIEVTEYQSHGGFGITYQGNYQSRKDHDESFTTQRVIIKEFFMDMGNNGKCLRASDGETVVFADNKENIYHFQKKFENESDMLSKITHPNVVRMLHDFKANNTSYFVMEYINGVTLKEYIEKYGVFTSFDEAWKYMAPLCDGLKKVHSKGILHCDISPNNIMVETGEDGRSIQRMVLIDFGGCRSYNVNEKEGADFSRISLIPYTYSYSPLELTNLRFYNDTFEDAQVKEIKASTDIYSIGATLYFIMTGEHPQDCYTVMKKGIEFPEDLDPRLASIITSAMRPKRDDRPQTMEELISLCSNALETETDKLRKEIEELKYENDEQRLQIVELEQKAYLKVKQSNGRVAVHHYKDLYEQQQREIEHLRRSKPSKTNRVANQDKLLKFIPEPKGTWWSLVIFCIFLAIQLATSVILPFYVILASDNYIVSIPVLMLLFLFVYPFFAGFIYIMLKSALNWDSWGVYLDKKNGVSNRVLKSISFIIISFSAFMYVVFIFGQIFLLLF